ncbi:MAG: hypothetical protein ACFFDH_07365 [Promethearchaeota archaeon]
MEDKNIVLCQVKFRNGHTGTIRAEIGFLHEKDISHFFIDENNFVQFMNKDTISIPKCDIIEIVRYKIQKIITPDNERRQWSRLIQKSLIPEMSFL